VGSYDSLPGPGPTPRGVSPRRTCPALASRAGNGGSEVGGASGLVQGDLRYFELSDLFYLVIAAVRTFAYLITRQEPQWSLAAGFCPSQAGGPAVIDLAKPPPDWLSTARRVRPPYVVRSLPSAPAVAARRHGDTDLATEVYG